MSADARQPLDLPAAETPKLVASRWLAYMLDEGHSRSELGRRCSVTPAVVSGAARMAGRMPEHGHAASGPSELHWGRIVAAHAAWAARARAVLAAGGSA